MSRIGKKNIDIPASVKVNINESNVTVEGSKGKLEHTLNKEISIEINDNKLQVNAESEQKRVRALHGLTRALIANMIEGVTNGFIKKLEIVGVGYRANLKGKDLELSIGKSHPVIFKGREGVDLSVPDQTHIEISGIDRQKVGQVAADIRALYKPEPYKGKGIRYEGEYVRKKVGKTVG